MNPADVTRYAGPAPDWLDEMAAVLLENDALTDGRVEGLVTANAAADELQALWPLEEFFTMTHPAFEQARRVIEARRALQKGGHAVALSCLEAQTWKSGMTGAVRLCFMLSPVVLPII